MADPRVAAVRVLYAVVYQQQQLKPVLQQHSSQLNEQNRAWLQALCYHTLRHYHQLQARWQKFTPKKVKDNLVALLLTTAMAQKWHFDTPDHAIVNESVKALNRLKKRWASGLVNKVLRLALQDTDFEPADAEARHSHPQWLIDLIQTDWPDDWQQLLQAGLQQPPLWVRATDQANLQDARPHPYIPGAFRIPAADIRQQTAFRNGHISVQDASAQLAGHILQPQPGEHILDVCAAPGGKSCHLLQLCPDIDLTAIEKHSARIDSIRQNLQRIGARAHIVQADARHPQDWPGLAKQHYQKILADVPCSATGVIRRHPDIKLHRQPQDIEDLVQLQREILAGIAPLLPVGGLMLYATCSILAKENWQQMAHFLEHHPNFSEQKIRFEGPRRMPHGIQILTGDADMDGFYYCLLKKTA